MAEDKMQKKVKVTNTRDGSTSYANFGVCRGRDGRRG